MATCRKECVGVKWKRRTKLAAVRHVKGVTTAGGLPGWKGERGDLTT